MKQKDKPVVFVYDNGYRKIDITLSKKGEKAQKNFHNIIKEIYEKNNCGWSSLEDMEQSWLESALHFHSTFNLTPDEIRALSKAELGFLMRENDRILNQKKMRRGGQSE